MKSFLTAIVVLSASTALGWGFDGHRRLTKMMQEPLPSSCCLAQWLSLQQSAAFQDDACDPDRWRMEGNSNYDPEEWPRHFLEIDYASPVTSYPRDFDQVKTQFGVFAEKNGQVPWRVEFMYRTLVEAFRTKNANTIRTRLAHMSHYVTDAFSVLHNTKNFDPNGLHQRWESDMLDSVSRLDAVSTRARLYFGTVGQVDPVNNVFDIVEVGNGLLPELIRADVNNPTDMAAFFNEVLDLTARRFADALTLQASLVASAWLEAGAPTLPGMSNTCEMELKLGTLEYKGYLLPPQASPPPVEESPQPVDDPAPPQGCSCQNSNGFSLLALLGVLGGLLWHRRFN